MKLEVEIIVRMRNDDSTPSGKAAKVKLAAKDAKFSLGKREALCNQVASLARDTLLTRGLTVEEIDG